MHPSFRTWLVAMGATFLALVGSFTLTPAVSAHASVVGAVYTETNATSSNAVVAFVRTTQGTLTRLGSYATGGRGSGGTVDPLQSQYALIVTDDGHWLFAVNAGSNTVTSFAIGRDGSLERVGSVSSGGQRPVSLAAHDNVLYVLNNGGTTDNDHGTGNIVGFSVRRNGSLTPLANDTRALSGSDVGASTIAFSRDGRYLLVTERDANKLDLYTVGPDGRASAAHTSAAAAPSPFGFGFGERDIAIISEATNQQVSSYRADDEALNTVNTLGTNAAAPCWAQVSPSGRYAYVANAGGGVLTGYRITDGGHLSALASSPIATGNGSTPIDVEFSRGGHWLFTLNTGTGTIGIFTVGDNGTLSAQAPFAGFPAASGYQGLAAW